MDPRWQNLPHTDTEFVPASYPDRQTWEAERARIRQQVLFAAGLWPMPEKPPLDARIWNRIERDGYTVEKVWFQSLPGFYVGGSLFRPIDPRPKGHPGVISPHGHAALGRLGDAYQARGITLAKIGCTAFMWDLIDYNDSARHLSGHYEDETYATVHRAPWAHERDERMLWNLNALGFQLWNGIRAVDLLTQLPEVDPNRLACTGESGGGSQTFNLYAVDDRLAAAAPVCMVSAYMQGGCVCENAPLLRIDTNNVDIGATMAPKPLLIVSSTQDWTRHTPEVEYPAIRRIYELYGAGDQVAQVQVDAPHGYNQEMREAVYRWFAKWLDLPIGQDYVEPPFETEPPENLLAFLDDMPGGAIDNHQDLFRQCIEAAEKALESYHPETAEKLGENRRVLGQSLRLAVGDDGSGVTLERGRETQSAGLACTDGFLVGERRGVRVPVRTFAPDAPSGASVLLVHPQGINALYSPLVRDLVAQGQTVYAIDPFGIGRNVGEQNPEQPRGSTRHFTTFNRTDDAERVCDILLALRYVLSTEPQTVHVAAFDRAGLWTLLAGAILGPQETKCRFVVDTAGFDTSGPGDYLDYLPIPGILRAGGLPNAAALVAPHDLVLHNTREAFDSARAQAAYALYPGTTFTVHEERLRNDELVAFLME